MVCDDVPVARTGESVDEKKTTNISQTQHVDTVVEVLVCAGYAHAVEKTGEIAQVMIQEVLQHALRPVMRLVAVAEPTLVGQTVKSTIEGTQQAQFMNKVVDISVVAQRQILVVQTIENTIEIPQLQHSEKEVDVLVEQVVPRPQAHAVQKTVAIPQTQVIDRGSERSRCDTKVRCPC